MLASTTDAQRVTGTIALCPGGDPASMKCTICARLPISSTYKHGGSNDAAGHRSVFFIDCQNMCSKHKEATYMHRYMICRLSL